MSVVSIKAGRIVPQCVAEPNEELIQKLEGMLVEARSGQLRAIGCVEVDASRAISTDWAGQCDSHDMTAGVAILQHRYLTNMRLDEDG